MQVASPQIPSVPATDFWSWFVDKMAAPLATALVVGLTVSWVIALLLESHRARRDYLTREIDDIRSSIQKLWELASEYWGAESLPNRSVLEEKIQFIEAEVRATVIEFCSKFDGSFATEATTELVALTKFLTGGDFGSDERTRDVERLSNIRAACVSLRRVLIAARKARLNRPFKIGH